MRAAVDDVHHRHRQDARADAADIAVERQAAASAAALATASETPRIALAPSRALFGVPSSAIIVVVDLDLVLRVHPAERVEDFAD